MPTFLAFPDLSIRSHGEVVKSAATIRNPIKNPDIRQSRKNHHAEESVMLSDFGLLGAEFPRLDRRSVDFGTLSW